MKLDIAAATCRSRGTQFARRLVISVAQPDPEPVAAAWLAVVFHPDSEPHSEAARPAIDYAFPADITCVRKRRVHEVPRDIRTSQVSRRVEAMVENIHMSPK